MRAMPGEVIGEALGDLQAAVRGRVAAAEPIAPLTSLRLGGPAGIFVEAESEDDLLAVAHAQARHRLPLLALGRGTNLLVSDRGFPGIVLRLGTGFEWIAGEGDVIEAGSATPLPRVANWAARRGLAGLEFATAIPATVGGGVRMNAGAHGASMADVLDSARVCRLPERRIVTMAAAALRMHYRETVLTQDDLVCSARFALSEQASAEILARMAGYRAHRAATQPVEAPNAGSMFRNPEGDSAGRLIEAAGLKGRRVGGADVSTKHANFFLAHPGATAQEVHDLLALVQRTVRESIGVVLVPEIRIAGEFDRAEALEVYR